MSSTWFPGITPGREVPAEIDTGVAHPARVCDYILGGKNNAGTAATYRRAGIAFQYRAKEEFAQFFTGLELMPPGIVPMAEWRAESEPGPRPALAEASACAVAARKN